MEIVSRIQYSFSSTRLRKSPRCEWQQKAESNTITVFKLSQSRKILHDKLVGKAVNSSKPSIDVMVVGISFNNQFHFRCGERVKFLSTMIPIISSFGIFTSLYCKISTGKIPYCAVKQYPSVGVRC